MSDKTTNILGGIIIVGSVIYITSIYIKKKSETTEIVNSKVTKKTNPKSTLTLDKIVLKIPQRQFIIKDRQKFLDEWAAEEGGVQSIRDMYKKRPSAFQKYDVIYLQSKGILPSEKLVGKGINTTTTI
jgi:hypothetical protein